MNNEFRLEEGENFRTQPEDEWPKAGIIMKIFSITEQTSIFNKCQKIIIL